MSFEVIADIGFMDLPQCFFDALALLRDQLFCLMREILNALPNLRATLKPARIGIRVIILLTVPAGLPVSSYARQDLRRKRA